MSNCKCMVEFLSMFFFLSYFKMSYFHLMISEEVLKKDGNNYKCTLTLITLNSKVKEVGTAGDLFRFLFHFLSLDLWTLCALQRTQLSKSNGINEISSSNVWFSNQSNMTYLRFKCCMTRPSIIILLALFESSLRKQIKCKQ